MPNTKVFPFNRVSVDHFVRGSSRVFWELLNSFHDPLPYSFQLQTGRTGSNDSADWENVGPPVENSFFAIDDEQRLHGKRLLTHYRVVLSTPVKTYVSEPASSLGLLSTRDWRLAKEIIRKEQLRHRYASSDGTLLKRLRYGDPCTECRDPLTEEIVDSDCPQCNGVGFLIGFHTPIPFQLFDLSPETINEDRDLKARGTIRDTVISARVLGFPQLSKYDAWVDVQNDQRWIIHRIDHKAEIRGVPLIMQVELRLAPFSHAIYKVEVGGEPADLPGPILPTTGTGSIPVDHDFGGPDNLAYLTGPNCDIPVSGATVRAFRKVDHDAGNAGAAFIVAQTHTMANGRWAEAMKLDPGEYTIVFFKLGEFGPDTVGITVTDGELVSSSSESEAPSASDSSSDSSSSSSSFWDV